MGYVLSVLHRIIEIGEGIDLILCDGCVARDNTVHDVWPVFIYTDHGKNILIERNYVYDTSDAYIRDDYRANAFVVGDEDWTDLPVPSTNITIKNNLGVNVCNGISYYGQNQWYAEMVVLFNTFHLIDCQAVVIPDAATAGKTYGNVLRNNIFQLKDSSDPVSLGSEFSSTWTVSANYWLNCDSSPIPDTTGKSSIASSGTATDIYTY